MKFRQTIAIKNMERTPTGPWRKTKDPVGKIKPWTGDMNKQF